MTDESTEAITVWRASTPVRIFCYVAIALLVLFSARILIQFGSVALIGVALVLGACVAAWWQVLRPRMTAGPDGIEVVHGRQVVRLPWRDVRRCEPRIDGLHIVGPDGLEVTSRYPAQRKAAADEPTEADLTAAYLAQRAAWARKPTGDPPRYVPPPARR